MSELITESGSYEEPKNPRYADPPVVHLEQVLWCCWCFLNEDKKEEALTIFNGKAMCERHLYQHAEGS